MIRFYCQQISGTFSLARQCLIVHRKNVNDVLAGKRLIIVKMLNMASFNNKHNLIFNKLFNRYLKTTYWCDKNVKNYKQFDIFKVTSKWHRAYTTSLQITAIYRSKEKWKFQKTIHDPTAAAYFHPLNAFSSRHACQCRRAFHDSI